MNITQSTDSSDDSSIDSSADSSTDTLYGSDLMRYLSGESELQKKLEESITKLTQDLSEEYLNDDPGTAASPDPAEMRLKQINNIEALFMKLTRDTVEYNALELTFRNTRSWDNCDFDQMLSLKTGEDSVMTKVKFSKEQSTEKFSMLYFVLSMIYNLLSTQQTSTKRELYYQNIDHFRSQSMVDGLLNDASNLLEVPLYELNVFATSKGLVYGPLKLVIEGEEIDCGDAKGTLIPENVCLTSEVKSVATYILVVEKDATFQKLLDNGAADLLSTCIFITGKGYPDTNTRLLLRKLWDALKLPILTLVDPDPWGIEIMCIYRFGSLSMAHQADHLAVPSSRWLGIHPTEVDKLYDEKLPLVKRDKDKLADLLQRPYIQSNEPIKHEIQFLLDKSFKAEIEGVEITPGYLANIYLPQKITCADIK